MSTYTKGIALILEGDTELYFYLELLNFLVKQKAYIIKEKEETESYENYYEIKTPKDIIIVKLKNVGTITQFCNQVSWFKNNCMKQYNTNWTVCLCHDTDSKNTTITKFNEGDWKNFKEEITSCNAIVLDLAASYDIEDIMLRDFNGVLNFLNLPKNTLKPTNMKGKSKMKRLYRLSGKTYHEGIRSRNLIKSLDFNEILKNSNDIPYNQLVHFLD